VWSNAGHVGYGRDSSFGGVLIDRLGQLATKPCDAAWGIRRSQACSLVFNAAEKWSSDVSEDVAWEVLNTSSQGLALPPRHNHFVSFMSDYGRLP
jgi:hypothetical protein